MTILALEFSSLQRSVAISRGETVLAQAIESNGRNTTAFAMMEQALAEAKMEREQVEAIAVGLGPGSYTGIRAAISVAQGWQLAKGVKTAGISSVEAIAAQSQENKIFGRVNVMIDAQRNDVYLAVYEISAMAIQEVDPLSILPVANIQTRLPGEMFTGPEITKWIPSGKTIFPSAAMLVKLAAAKGNFIPAEKLKPIYLRETSFVKAPPPRIIPGT